MEVASAGEVVSVFVEGESHDSVCRVESLLHAVAMVNINVNIQHSLVVPGKHHQIIITILTVLSPGFLCSARVGLFPN